MNLEEFFEKVEFEAKQLLPFDDIWYRGHSNSSYQLVPSINRGSVKNEIALFYDYKAYAAAINSEHKDNWELLLDMQHYGLPTRLLDWTTSLGTALYFALKGTPESPCIWLLDPYALSYQSTGSSVVYDTTQFDSRSTTYEKDFDVSKLIVRESRLKKAFSIQPPQSNRRIAAQRGRFTVHGRDSKPIEEQFPKGTKKIVIPSNLVQQLQKYLVLLGIDDYSQFPDHEGLSAFLKGKYAL
ncbi:FRG domain-containing protein [Aliivibrio salmonicida]|uniref:FRG domain-containing protein n=1 Tax=Aliivibrio salmonicida TaxID=40269 RepID=UPI00406C4BAA